MSTGRTCFVKLSGDTFSDEVFAWVELLGACYFKVVVCVGGGTQINEAFKQAGFPLRKYGPFGRETSPEEAQLALKVLKRNRARVQRRLKKLGIQNVHVVIPVRKIGGELCHINGDDFTIAAFHGFDILYIVTTAERLEAKICHFKNLQEGGSEKIVIVGEGSLPRDLILK